MNIIILQKKTFATEPQRPRENNSEKATITSSDFTVKPACYFNNFSLLSSAPLCLCGGPAFLAVFAVLIATLANPASAAEWKCTPTPQDEIGPFYRPNMPQRSKIGSGYVLEGTVRSAATCQPIPGARVEFWQAGPDGNYSDAYRAALLTDNRGHYRLTTSIPPPYASRPSHIHILVDMRGYAGLITQHYPKAGKRNATFDLVLETE